ncbi:MAG: HAMP domain-containing protein [Nitrospirota bacterium]
MPRLGLRHQLLAWFLWAGVTPALLGIASLYWYSLSERALETDAAVQARADVAAERFGLAVDSARRELVFVAEQAQRARETRSWLDWDAAAVVLSAWGDRSPVPVGTLAVHNTSGDLLIGYQRRLEVDAAVDPEVERVMAAQAASSGRVVFGGAGAPDQSAPSALGVAVPLIGADGAVAGALYGAVPVHWFVRALTLDSSDGGSLRILDHVGRTVVSVGERVEAATGSAAASRQITLPGVATPWMLSVAVPGSVIAEQAGLQRYAALVGAAVLLALLFAWGISRSIVRPIREIDDGARRIAQGDFDFQISTATNNELERVAGSFQQMAYNLKRAQERLTKAERLAAIGEKTLDLQRDAQDHLARAGSAGQRLQGRADLPPGAREQVNEIVDAIAGAQTTIRQIEHVPDHAGDPPPRPRRSDAAAPPSPRRAEGVA